MGVKEGTGQLRNAVSGDLYIGEFKKDKFNGKVRAFSLTLYRVN